MVCSQTNITPCCVKEFFFEITAFRYFFCNTNSLRVWCPVTSVRLVFYFKQIKKPEFDWQSMNDKSTLKYDNFELKSNIESTFRQIALLEYIF